MAARAYVEIAQGELDAAERDAYDALDLAADLGSDIVVPFALDGLAMAARDADDHLTAARLFGAAEAARRHMGMVRFKVLDAAIKVRASLRFEMPWAKRTSTPRGAKARR